MKPYHPNVSRDEDDDGEGAEPGISNSEQDISRNLWASKVPQREENHA